MGLLRNAVKLLAVPAMLAWQVVGKTYTVPNALYNGPVNVEFTSHIGELDGQKITPYINDTTFEWWYFDVVSTTSANESIVVVFYESTPDGFIGGVPGFPVSVSLTGTFANGTGYQVIVPIVDANASAVITTSGNGASGNWQTTGFSFEGTALLTEYTITIDNPAYGVKGTVKLNSIAPAHYPCGLGIAGSTEVICPHVGWSNAVPGAMGTVSLTIGDTDISYTGVGYHDKNWGDIPFFTAITSWYWGHAKLGPYTLVWFDAMGVDGKEYVSGYVSLNGVIVGTSCVNGTLSARPFGANSEYPPKLSSGTPTGFAITVSLFDGCKFAANATTGLTTIGLAPYGRYIGDITGGVVGGTQYSGRALWDQFKLNM